MTVDNPSTHRRTWVSTPLPLKNTHGVPRPPQVIPPQVIPTPENQRIDAMYQRIDTMYRNYSMNIPSIFSLILVLLTLTGCPTIPNRPLHNPEGYDQETVDHYRTRRTEENPVVTLRVQLDPASTEYTEIRGRVVGRTVHFLDDQGILHIIPIPHIHEEDRL